MQASHFGFTIAEVPARCRYFEDASSVGFKAGAVYGIEDAVGRRAAVLHRRGVILRSRKFSGAGPSSTTVKPRVRLRDRAQAEARARSAAAPTAAAGAQPADRDGERVHARVGRAASRAPRAPPGPSACGRRRAGASTRARSAGQLLRGDEAGLPADRPGTAGRRGRCAAGSRVPGPARRSRGSRARPACWRASSALARGRRRGERRRMPEPVERAAAASGHRARRARARSAGTAPRPTTRRRRTRAPRTASAEGEAARCARAATRRAGAGRARARPVSSAGSATWMRMWSCERST